MKILLLISLLLFSSCAQTHKVRMTLYGDEITKYYDNDQFKVYKENMQAGNSDSIKVKKIVIRCGGNVWDVPQWEEFDFDSTKHVHQ